MKTIVLALAALAIAAPAEAASKKKTKRAYAPQQQIACTEVGCLPVPRGCYPTGGKAWDGLPSGFDVMVCPGGTMYGRR
jgi:hypothetical protein